MGMRLLVGCTPVVVASWSNLDIPGQWDATLCLPGKALVYLSHTEPSDNVERQKNRRALALMIGIVYM